MSRARTIAALEVSALEGLYAGILPPVELTRADRALTLLDALVSFQRAAAVADERRAMAVHDDNVLTRLEIEADTERRFVLAAAKLAGIHPSIFGELV